MLWLVPWKTQEAEWSHDNLYTVSALLFSVSGIFSSSSRMSLHTSQHAILQPCMGSLSGNVTFSSWSPPTQQRPCKLSYGKLPQKHTHHLPSNLDTLFIISCESPDIFPHLCSFWLEVRKYLHKGKGHILLKGDQMEIRMPRNESLLDCRRAGVILCLNGSAWCEAAWVEEALLWGKHRAEIMDQIW